MNPRIIILSGPSGVGKDTVLDLWIAQNPLIRRVVAYTTRQPREGEVDGVDYNFVTRERFQEMAENGEFLEFKMVYGNGYATPISGLNQLLASGKHAVLKIDVQGALEAMEKRPEALTIFLHPPSLEELERRIRARGTESEEAVTRRMEEARAELDVSDRYKYQVTNHTIEETLSHLKEILETDEVPTPR